MRVILLGVVLVLVASAPGTMSAAQTLPAPLTLLPAPPSDLAPAVAALRDRRCGNSLDALGRAAGASTPEGARAVYLLARCAEAEGRHADASRIYLDAADRHRSLSARAHLGAARSALRAGDSSRALAMAEVAPGTSPATSARLRLVRSEALRRQGRHRDAAGEARRVTDASWAAEGPYLSRMQAEAWWQLARALDAAHDPRAARSAYTMVWWGFPDNPWAAAASQRIRALSAGRAPAPSAHARAVRALHLLERWESEAAERELAQAVKGTLPASVAAEAWYQLGLLRVGTRAGVMAFEQASRFPRERDRTLYWLGVARLRTGRGVDAASAWAQLRATYPDSLWTARALATQGRIAEAAGRWQEADRFYALVIDRYPDSPRSDDARWRRAWMRRQRGLRSDARALLLHYGRTAPDAPRAGAQLYWAARLSGADQDAGSLWREVAEQYPLTFYGQRARQRLSLPPAPAPAELSASPLSPARFHVPYEELAVLGAADEAMEEIEVLLTDDAPDAVRLAAAELYADAGDATRAIIVLEPLIGRALYARRPASRAFWQLAYPRPFWPTVVREAARRGVDPLLVLAVMREESRFDPRAVSTANAVGLMQLLPSTARGVLGAPVSPAALKQPDLNVRAGTAYMAGLLRRYGGRVPPAVAAYNAGPGGVRRHVDLARTDLDRFVEELPYAETRAYVQRVLQSYGIYRWLYR